MDEENVLSSAVLCEVAVSPLVGGQGGLICDVEPRKFLEDTHDIRGCCSIYPTYEQHGVGVSVSLGVWRSVTCHLRWGRPFRQPSTIRNRMHFINTIVVVVCLGKVEGAGRSLMSRPLPGIVSGRRGQRWSSTLG